jgi:hypothetical protein
VPEEVASVNTFIPMESLDLPTEAPETFFTVGVVAEFQAPEKSKTGKVYCSLKMATLMKHNLHLVKKLLPFPHTPIQAKQVERSFNRDGYKTLRVLAFGEELCKTLKKRVGYPGMVICL